MKDIIKSNSLCNSEDWQKKAQEILGRLTVEIERATLVENQLGASIQSINDNLNNFYNKNEIASLLEELRVITTEVVQSENAHPITSNGVFQAFQELFLFVNIAPKLVVLNDEAIATSSASASQIREAIYNKKIVIISYLDTLATAVTINGIVDAKVIIVDNEGKLSYLTIKENKDVYKQDINLNVDIRLNENSNNAIANSAVTQALQSIISGSEILRFDGIVDNAIIDEGDSEVSGGIYYASNHKLFLKDSGLADSTYYSTWDAYGNYKASSEYNNSNTLFKNKLYAIVTNKLDLYMYSESEQTLVNITSYIQQAVNSANTILENKIGPVLGTVTNVRSYGAGTYVGNCDLSPWNILLALRDGKSVVLQDNSFLRGAIQITYAYLGAPEEVPQQDLNTFAGFLGFIGSDLYYVTVYSEVVDQDWNIKFTPLRIGANDGRVTIKWNGGTYTFSVNQSNNSTFNLGDVIQSYISINEGSKLINISQYVEDDEPYGGAPGDYALVYNTEDEEYSIWFNEDDNWGELDNSIVNKDIIIYDNNIYKYLNSSIEKIIDTEVDLDNYLQYAYLPFEDSLDDSTDLEISIENESFSGTPLGSIYYSPSRNKFLLKVNDRYYQEWSTKRIAGNGAIVNQRFASTYYNNEKYRYIFINRTERSAYVYLNNILRKIGGDGNTLDTLPSVKILKQAPSVLEIPQEPGFYKVTTLNNGFLIYERKEDNSIFQHNTTTLPPMYFVYNDSLMKWENGTLQEETPDLFARDENAANILKIDEFINVNIVRVAQLTVQTPGDIVYNRNTNKFYLRYQVNDSYTYANVWVSTDNIKGSIYYNNNEGYPKENNLYYYINTNSDLNETSFYVSDGTELKLYTENKGVILVKYWLRESDYNLGGLNQTLQEGEYAYYWYTTRDEEEYGVLVTRYKGEILEITNPNQHCIYISEPKNSIYRWDGQKMVFISGSNDPLANIPVVTVIGENTTTQPPQNTAGMTPGYYVYLNGGNKMTLYLLRNNRWIQVPEDAIMYVIWNGKLFLYQNGEFSNGQSIREIYYNQDDTMEDEDYYIDTEEMKVYQYIEGESPEDVTESLSSVYKYNNILYITNSAGILEKVNSEGMAPVKVDVDTQLNTTSTNPVENRVIATKFSEVDETLVTTSNTLAAHTEEIQNINKEDYRKNNDAEDERIYPEYWYDIIEQEKKIQDNSYVVKPIVYAKNYYDWNFVKYNDDVDVDTVPLNTIQDNINVEVLYPRDELAITSFYNSIVPSEGVDTRSVYYHETLGSFIIKVDNTYYYNWNNSNLWKNNEGELRSDTVYSRIVYGDLKSGTGVEELFWPVAWIVKDDERVDLLDQFTDFAPAIKRTIIENQGVCRLHSTKIYGCSSTIGVNATEVQKIDFDGQGAVICRVPAGTYKEQVNPKGSNPLGSLNQAGSGISIKNVDDIGISNVKVFAVRSAIRNSASNLPPSYSNSNLYGIQVDAANNYISDVRIKNVQFKGCAYDLRIGGSYRLGKVVVEDWKSNDCEGSFWGGIESLIIDRADLIQAEVSSKHMLYCGDVGDAQSHVIKNSRFIQNSMFNDNFIQYKPDYSSEDAEGKHIKRYSGNHSENDVDYIVPNVKFLNCHMRIGRGMVIYSPYNDLHFELDGCTIVQHDKFITKNINANVSRNTVGFWGGSNFSNMATETMGVVHFNSRASLTIRNTTFKVWNRPVYMGGTATIINQYNSSPATPDYINLNVENSRFLLNDIDNYATQHIAPVTVESWKHHMILILVSNGSATYNGSVSKHMLSNETNYIPPTGYNAFTPDNTTSTAKASASDFAKSLPVGFSYFNTVAGKPLWIGSINQDGTYNWYDYAGTQYDSEGQPVNS